MKKLILFSLLFCTQVIQAKSLYLTVNRDYSNKEEPEIMVNYTRNQPLEFRVLKPKNLADFISSQIDLRRAWREPKTTVNSALYLMKGLNRSKIGLDWIRYVVDENLRNDNKEIFGGGKFKALGTPIDTGPTKLISYPDKFEHVSTFYVFPNKSDRSEKFDVPGFNYWSNYNDDSSSSDDGDGDYEYYTYRSNDKVKLIKLPTLEPGFYLVQVVQGSLEGQVVLVVNNLYAKLQQSSDYSLVTVADRSGNPISDAIVKIRNLRGEWFKEGKTNRDGVFEFKTGGENELIVSVEKEKYGTAIIDSEFFSTNATYPDLYLYSDRPMYKTTSEINYKGILRKRDDGLSRLLYGPKSALVSVVNSDDQTIIDSQKVDINEYGTFTGLFNLNDLTSLDNGLYRLKAKIIDDSFIGEFRVKDYIKPLLFAKIKSEQEGVKPGDTISGLLEVGKYAGGVPRSGKFTIELFRIRAQTPEWLVDAGMDSEGEQQTYNWDKKQVSDVTAPLLISSLEDMDIINGKSKFDINIPHNLPGDPNYDYQIMLKATIWDEDKNYITTSKMFIEALSEVKVIAQATHSFIPVNEEASLSVRSVYPSGKPYGKTKGRIMWYHQPYGQDFNLVQEENFTTDDTGKIKFDVPTNKVGLIKAQITIEDNNGSNAQTSSSLVVTGKNNDSVIKVGSLELKSRRDFYFLGEEAKIFVLMPEGWGKNGTNKGNLYITVGGNEIFDHRLILVDGLSQWIEQKIEKRFGTSVYIIVSYADPKKGWVEKRFNIRIPQKDKNISIKITPQLANVLPGEEQEISFKVSDSEGKPLETELSISVVDKSVLALQPEIRPSLLDFFYPAERLNVMSFYSSSFQGYGYGEYITGLFKSNHFVAMTKQEGKKVVERDTAYWNADLETNSKGIASVNFRMPANQTIWNVTAIALDKEGRFGENTTEFTSQMPLQFTLAYPNFSRIGDKFDLTMNVANEKMKEDVSFSSTLTTSGALKLLSENVFRDKLKLRESKKYNLKLSYENESDEKKFSITNNFQMAGRKNLVFEYEMLNKNGFLEMPNSLAFNSNDSLEYDFSNERNISEVSLSMYNGLLSTFVASMDFLLKYPHGCVEQLVNTTVPNLVIAKIFNTFKEKELKEFSENSYIPWDLMGIMRRNFTDLRRYVRMLYKKRMNNLDHKTAEKILKAREFANSGLAKLKEYQSKNDGYRWFPESDHSNTSMTFLVLLSVYSTEDRELVSNIDGIKLLNWLKKNITNNQSVSGVAYNYLESLAVKMGLKSIPSDKNIPNIKLLLDYVLKSGSIFEKAMVLSSIEYTGIRNHEDVLKKREVIVEELKSFVSSENRSPSSVNAIFPKYDSGFRYPGGESSVYSFVGKALFEAGEMTDSLRKKYSQELMKDFNGISFGSTVNTSMAILNSSWLITEEINHSMSEERPVVFFNDIQVPKSEIEGISSFNGFKFSIPAKFIPKGKAKIKIETENSYSNVLLTYKGSRLMASQKEYNNGWNIEREYYLLNSEGTKEKLTGNEKKLKIGDLVYVKLIAKKTDLADKLERRSTYFFVKSYIPAGMTLVEEMKDTLVLFGIKPLPKEYDQKVNNPDEVKFYFEEESISDKDYRIELEYLLRASYSGEFNSGIAQIEDFYNENIRGVSPSDRVVITQ